MPKITIAGVLPGIDGDYLLDLEDVFTGNELHLIKQHAGIRVGEISEAMAAGDYDLVVCLTKIALDRNHRNVTIEQLMDAKVGAITFEQTDEEKAADLEEEQLPPGSAPDGRSETESSPTTSGTSSSNGSDSLPESALPVIGAPDSPIGSPSGKA